MIFNLIVALFSGFMAIHKVNTLKVDYNTPYSDCKVWGFDDGAFPSKIRWAASLGLDSIDAAAASLLFVDAVSGGNIRSKAIREFLGGFENASDLKDKYNNVKAELEGETKTSRKIVVSSQNLNADQSCGINSEKCLEDGSVPMPDSNTSNNFNIYTTDESFPAQNSEDCQSNESSEVVSVAEDNKLLPKIDTTVTDDNSCETQESLPGVVDQVNEQNDVSSAEEILGSKESEISSYSNDDALLDNQSSDESSESNNDDVDAA